MRIERSHDHMDFDQEYILRKFGHEPAPETDLRGSKGCMCPSCFLKAHGYMSMFPTEDFIHHLQMSYVTIMLLTRTLHHYIEDMDKDVVSVSSMMESVSSLADLTEAACTIEGVANMLWEDEGSKSSLPSAAELIRFIEENLLGESK